MALFLIIALVVALYLRTLNYNYVIDDNVKRDGYMYEVPLEGPPPGFYGTKPSKLYRLFVIGMHCVNTAVIYLLWGWAPALLFAVHPSCVWGTAWITGNYYATSAYFCLIAYYILPVLPNAIGAVIAMALYAAAVNSTICCLTFPFLFFFIGTPWGLTLFFPLAMFLRGKRFKTGIKTRLDFNTDKPVKAHFTWRRLLVIVKVIARYLFTALVPERQGFFRAFGRCLYERQAIYDRMHSANSEFWYSLALCLSVTAVGFVVSPVGTLWFFGLILLHSQWNLTGQFFAERYLYMPIVGLCIIAGTVLAPYPILMAIVAAYLAYRTHKFIPVWENQEEVWKHDLEVFPENSQCYNNLAQWYMNMRGHKMPVFKVNEIAMLLQRARAMSPDSWEISMNLACYFVMIGNIRGGLEMTDKAIEQLLPISGGSGQYPLSKLRAQKIKIEEALEKQAALKQQQGGLDLSHPKTIKEEGDDTRKEESAGEKPGVLEPSGAGGA